MPILISFLFLFHIPFVFSKCEFKKNVPGIVSLAGPVTVLLNELGLLKSPKVTGVSVFNPIKSSDYLGKVYPGGIFLSQKVLEEFDGKILFYDEGRELRRILKSRPRINSIEIKTRNLTPSESIKATLHKLSAFLENCEGEIAQLNEEVIRLEKTILEKIKNKPTIVFFLGDFKGERLPETVMVEDGVVKWLKIKQIILTYPTSLAYVNWSSKILKGLPKSTIHVGVKDSGRNGETKIKKSHQRISLIYPGSLVPGLSQLRSFAYWAENL